MMKVTIEIDGEIASFSEERSPSLRSSDTELRRLTGYFERLLGMQFPTSMEGYTVQLQSRPTRASTPPIPAWGRSVSTMYDYPAPAPTHYSNLVEEAPSSTQSSIPTGRYTENGDSSDT